MSARCVATVLREVRHTGWTRHIPRLMVLGSSRSYRPDRRVGEDACPLTAGYWAFLHRHRDRLGRNPRTSRPVAGPDRLRDLPALLEQERKRGTGPP